jgi:LuxR family maltose regulon positive regulatory protein
MPLQILPTKLYRPAFSTGLVARAALLERLRGGVHNKVAIVSAPPGFGKTTLLAAWLAAEQDERVAWFSVDEDDNEPARFFAYFLAALRPHAPYPVQMAEPLLETLAPNPRELVVTLLSGWEAQLPKTTLILDDYHHITAQPIHSALTYLIENLRLTCALFSSAALGILFRIHNLNLHILSVTSDEAKMEAPDE